MPYDNEHACRLNDPKKYKRIRPGKDREHDGKTYRVLYGYFDKDGEETSEEQSYRYNKKTWSASEARKHCKDHDGTFEAAKEGEESSLLMNGTLIYNTVWAIKYDVLCQLVKLYNGQAVSIELYDCLEAARRQRATKYTKKTGRTAILPLNGIITQKLNLWSFFLGGTSTDLFGREFDAAINDNSIGAVVIDIDSPGGSVYGVPELARKIYNARGKKPIIAATNSLAASAAFWIASAADEIVITPSGEIGSVGVIAIHADFSKAEESFGVKVSLIYAGDYKIEGNPHEPLKDEARIAIQQRVDDYYGMFITDLAEFRGISERTVLQKFGKGRVVGADDAINSHMADKIGTMENIIADLEPKRNKMQENRNSLDLTKAQVAQQR